MTTSCTQGSAGGKRAGRACMLCTATAALGVPVACLCMWPVSAETAAPVELQLRDEPCQDCGGPVTTAPARGSLVKTLLGAAGRRKGV